MGRVAKSLAAKRAAAHKSLGSMHVDGSSLDQAETVAVGVIAGGERIVLDASRTTVGKTAELSSVLTSVLTSGFSDSRLTGTSGLSSYELASVGAARSLRRASAISSSFPACCLNWS